MLAATDMDTIHKKIVLQQEAMLHSAWVRCTRNKVVYPSGAAAEEKYPAQNNILKVQK